MEDVEKLTAPFVPATMYYLPVPADSPGRRLKVLAAGLYELSAKCEKLATELSAEAAASFVAASPWQSNVGVVDIAAAEVRKDMAELARRIDTRAAHYSRAGAEYTATEEGSVAQFRGLVP
jgi:hypothetical protein